MRETGYPGTNLKGKCHECYMYKPLVKMDHRTGILTKFARGKCMYPNRIDTYRQRTETCKKFIKKSLIQGTDKGKQKIQSIDYNTERKGCKWNELLIEEMER